MLDYAAHWQEQDAILNPAAAKYKDAVRERAEPPCRVRNPYARDRDRITHSKAFRRLTHKTQVFISPEGDHYRTRLTHTLEVTQISRTIARALFLNEDLTEAVALGHDLGHTPFGHAGEDALNALLPGGFCHNEMSALIATRVEKGGRGLNLTEQCLEGIKEHRTKGSPKSLEGQIVQIADKIAYVNHDIDDCLRAGILTAGGLPKAPIAVLGQTHAERINNLILSCVSSSENKNRVALGDEASEALFALRDFMFENVYEKQAPPAEREKIKRMFSAMLDYFVSRPDLLPDEFTRFINEGGTALNAAAYYIACMTDRFAVKKYEELLLPASFR